MAPVQTLQTGETRKSPSKVGRKTSKRRRGKRATAQLLSEAGGIATQSMSTKPTSDNNEHTSGSYMIHLRLTFLRLRAKRTTQKAASSMKLSAAGM